MQNSSVLQGKDWRMCLLQILIKAHFKSKVYFSLLLPTDSWSLFFILLGRK